jgi:hypothetical protein
MLSLKEITALFIIQTQIPYARKKINHIPVLTKDCRMYLKELRHAFETGDIKNFVQEENIPLTKYLHKTGKIDDHTLRYIAGLLNHEELAKPDLSGVAEGGHIKLFEKYSSKMAIKYHYHYYAIDAIRGNQLEMFRYLQTKGKLSLDWNDVECALEYGHHEMIKYCIECVPLDKYSRPVCYLKSAILGNNLYWIRRLSEREYQCVKNIGLIESARHGSLECIQLLIQIGAKRFHLAVKAAIEYKRKKEIFDLLLKYCRYREQYLKLAKKYNHARYPHQYDNIIQYFLKRRKIGHLAPRQ